MRTGIPSSKIQERRESVSLLLGLLILAMPAIADLDLPGYPAIHSLANRSTAFALQMSGAYAYPVPFKPADGHTVITFKNLASDATIKVYTIMGEKVIELKSSGASTLQWDLKNEDGDHVASGVYIYQIKSSVTEDRGKLMVIR